MARSVCRFDLAQQRRGTGADNIAQIVVGRGLEKELVVGSLPLLVGMKPTALA